MLAAWVRRRWWVLLAVLLLGLALGIGVVLSLVVTTQTSELLRQISSNLDDKDRADLTRSALQYQVDNLTKIWTAIVQAIGASLLAIGGYFVWRNLRVAQEHLEETRRRNVLPPEVIEQVANSNPSNIQEVAASQLTIISSYYRNVLSQAQQSFGAALVAAIVGLVFLLAAIGFLLGQSRTDIATVSVISGALVEVISGINFYLYARTSSQLSAFHLRLDRTQRLLLANSVCENLEGDTKATTRAELVRVIASGSSNDEFEPFILRPQSGNKRSHSVRQRQR